jgi:RNA polymerase sigma-70 factor (ECF subfamily)
MSDRPESDTRVTLLDKLRQDPRDDGAWGEFDRRYRPLILGWCRHWGLQEADADDVTQDVLLRLARKIKDFAYDPERRFRAWLRKLAQHAWSDFLKDRGRPGQGSGDSAVLRLLGTVAVGDDLGQRLEEQYDRELLALASARVRARVAAQTWEAFRLTALEGLPGAEAARRTGLKVGNVYVAKHNVEQLLREEVQKLEGEPPTEGSPP